MRSSELKERLFSLISTYEKEAKFFLKKLISIPSVSGEEEKALTEVKKIFSPLAVCKYIPIPERIKMDPEYSFHTRELSYKGRGNLLLELGHNSKSRSLVISTHIDTVESGRDYPQAFNPREKRGIVSGRGACDAKGQITSIFLVLLALKNLRIKLKGCLRIHIVIEEEIGGNGALAFIRKGILGDGAVVLEPTGLNIYSANRGALWFKIRIKGRPVHMGRKFEGINAIDKGFDVIRHLYKYERKLIRESRDYPLFEKYRYPVQLNIGMFHSGILPSMVAGEAEIEGGVGFLPNKTIDEIKRELRNVITGIDDPWIKRHYSLEFTRLHNDAYLTDPDNSFVRAFRDSLGEIGIKRRSMGWNVSCDARLYAKVGGIPTVVFGAGDVNKAHSREEEISIKDIIKASQGLCSFIIDWCGIERN